EALLRLDKASGEVSCASAELAALAQARLDECVAARTGGDVTRLVQRLFERQADLFAIRHPRGCYFVPQPPASLVGPVPGFLSAVGGRLARFPVPAGTPQGDRAVKDAVAEGIEALIEEHRGAIGSFGADTRPDTLARAAERVRLVRHKLGAYAAYLAGERSRLERELDEAAALLRVKVEALAAPVPAGT